MKIYTIKRIQFLPISISEAWAFFSTPKNLSKITPKEMGFEILYISGGEKMYTGQIIRYFVRVLPFIKMHWITEIKHVAEPHYFVDEQRFGPYALWHHQHSFKEIKGGIEMTDEVNYAIPFGFVGRLAGWLFVEQKVNAIFNYRFTILEAYFKNQNSEAQNAT